LSLDYQEIDVNLVNFHEPSFQNAKDQPLLFQLLVSLSWSLRVYLSFSQQFYPRIYFKYFHSQQLITLSFKAFFLVLKALHSFLRVLFQVCYYFFCQIQNCCLIKLSFYKRFFRVLVWQQVVCHWFVGRHQIYVLMYRQHYQGLSTHLDLHLREQNEH